MPYWIHENGETLGPMQAIDVLRRATPTTRVCDGEVWFLLDDDEEASHGAGNTDEPAKPEHIVIRYGKTDTNSTRQPESQETSKAV